VAFVLTRATRLLICGLFDLVAECWTAGAPPAGWHNDRSIKTTAAHLIDNPFMRRLHHSSSDTNKSIGGKEHEDNILGVKIGMTVSETLQSVFVNASTTGPEARRDAT
jgi:hypothetical protein